MATVMMHGELMATSPFRTPLSQHSPPHARFAKADRGGYAARRFAVPRERRMSTLTLAQANKIIAKALEKAREMKIKPAERRRARRRRPPEVDAARRRREHVPHRHRARQILGRRRHGCREPRARGPRKGQPELLRHARRDRARQVPAADRRRADPRRGGAIVGSAGASGGTGDEDEAVCAYGIEQAGFMADAKP